MPSLSPIFSGFGRRNRRYQQPRENERHFRQTCKSAFIKLVSDCFFANARREQEAEQMLRDVEYEQKLRRVMQQAEAMANKLAENGIVDKSDPSHKPIVTITESDMEGMAEELEPGCTESHREEDTKAKEDSATEKNSKCEGGENVGSGSTKSVDNFDIADIERFEAEHRDDSKRLRNVPVTTDTLVHQNEAPRTRKRRQVRFVEDNIQNRETNENANHHDNPLNIPEEPTFQELGKSVAGPSNNASKYSVTPVLPNTPSLATQVPRNSAKISGVNEGCRPLALTNKAPPHNPAQNTLKSSFIPVSTLDEGQSSTPTLIHEAPPPPRPSPTVPKSTLRQPSAYSRVHQDLVEGLFRDIRNFVSDIDESLLKIALSAQKRQVALTNTIRSMEIEIHKARWDSEIPEQLKTIVRCEKLNAELSRCLDAARWRLAGAH